jgi:uncharacterized protein
VLADSLIVPHCIHKPGSFTGLMTMYESNYLKLESLVGALPPQADRLVSHVAGDCDLHLTTTKREPYTTTLKLTYWFAESAPGSDEIVEVPDPDLTVRVYHDARLVEGVGGQHFHRHPMLRDLALEHSVELDRRWHVNIVLNKWLDYLLDMGHGFR